MEFISSFSSETDELCNRFISHPVPIEIGSYMCEEARAFPLHSHDYHEIVLCISGTGYVEIGGMHYSVSPGALCIYNQGSPHCEYYENGSNYFFQFSSEDIQGVGPKLIIPPDIPPVLYVDERDRNKIKTLLDMLWEEISRKELGHKDICLLLSHHVMILIIRKIIALYPYYFQKKRTMSDSHADEIRSWLDEHFTVKLSLEQIAKTFFLSPGYVSHIFKKSYGMPIMSYVTAKRLEHAKELLTKTEYSVSRISAMCGYSDLSQFCRYFKLQTGLSPASFRDNV